MFVVSSVRSIETIVTNIMVICLICWTVWVWAVHWHSSSFMLEGMVGIIWIREFESAFIQKLTSTARENPDLQQTDDPWHLQWWLMVVVISDCSPFVSIVYRREGRMAIDDMERSTNLNSALWKFWCLIGSEIFSHHVYQWNVQGKQYLNKV